MDKEEEVQTSLLCLVDGDLFKEVSEIYKKHGKFTDEVLLALHSVYGSAFERALDLLEKKCVTEIHATDGSRYIIQVSGSGGSLYTLFPQINYCPCPAYRYHVVGVRTDVSCKHVLAAQLTAIVGCKQKRYVSGKELSEILMRTMSVNNV